MSEQIGKVCGRCGETKPPADFPIRRASRDGLGAMCRACAVQNARRLRENDPGRREYDRRQNAAHHAASRRLREAYPALFRALYEEEKSRHRVAEAWADVLDGTSTEEAG